MLWESECLFCTHFLKERLLKEKIFSPDLQKHEWSKCGIYKTLWAEGWKGPLSKHSIIEKSMKMFLGKDTAHLTSWVSPFFAQTACLLSDSHKVTLGCRAMNGFVTCQSLFTCGRFPTPLCDGCIYSMEQMFADKHFEGAVLRILNYLLVSVHWEDYFTRPLQQSWLL